MELNLKLMTKGSKKLEKLKNERDTLTKEIYSAIDQSEKNIQDLGLNTKAETQADTDKQLSKIQNSLVKYGEFEKTIADLSMDLSESLNEYVNFAQESKNYQGIEKIVKIFSTAAANRMRVKRLNNQSPKENLQLILDFAEQIFHEISQERKVALSMYDKLRVNGMVISTKISEFGPREAELKEKLELFEEAYKNLCEKYDNADEKEQGELLDEKNNMHDQLRDLRHEYDQVLTIYKNAQETIKTNELTRDSYEKMARDLGRQATMIKEKIDGVTAIYLAAPTAVKIMMTTKGMEAVDESINTATDKSVNIITSAAEGVSDATLAREETQIVDPTVMKGYMDRMNQTMKDFNERFDEIRKKAKQPPKERYK